MEPTFKPTVFVFSFEGMTHVTSITNKKEEVIKNGVLSKSADDFSSYDDQGICEWNTQNGTEKSMYKMRAIARRQFKKILDRIYEIQEQYRENSPIAVKIFTSGDYQKAEIMRCWDKFYGNDDDRFFLHHFPVEFFNRSRFKTKEGKYLPEDTLESDFDKATLMNALYPQWGNEMPGLLKKRICLIDHDKKNLENARLYGFSEINFPIHNFSRENSVSFAEYSPKAFKKMNLLIDEAIGIRTLNSYGVNKINRIKNSNPFLINIQNDQEDYPPTQHCQLCRLL